MSERVALITGGARRLGAHLARTLAKQGFGLAVNYRSAEKDARALKEELTEKGTEVLLLPGDITHPPVREHLITRTIAHFGRLDLLINNASLFLPTEISDLSEALWDRIMGVNAKAPFFLSVLAYPHLKRTHGLIVNLVDTSALTPWRGYILHSISKGTLVQITRTLAVAFAPEVRVNAIAPGLVLPPEDFTEEDRRQALRRVPLKRPGAPEHVAQALLFFLDNDYVTGVVLPIDGGRHLG